MLVTSQVALVMKNPSAKAGDVKCKRSNRKTQVGEDPLEEGRATHSRILAWKIPWTEEPGGLQSRWSQLDKTEATTHHTQSCPKLSSHLRAPRLLMPLLSPQFDMQRITLEELKHILYHAFRDHLTMKDIENIIINEEESLNETSGNCQTEFEGGKYPFILIIGT